MMTREQLEDFMAAEFVSMVLSRMYLDHKVLPEDVRMQPTVMSFLRKKSIEVLLSVKEQAENGVDFTSDPFEDAVRTISNDTYIFWRETKFH